MIGAKFMHHELMGIIELKEMAEEVIEMFPSELNILWSEERDYEPVQAVDIK